jgi:hypothetical protein
MVASLESVRALYRAIRRLHRTLPSVQRALGDRVVKDEWQAMSSALRGNKATPVQQAEFVRQWNAYAQALLDTTLVRLSACLSILRALELTPFPSSFMCTTRGRATWWWTSKRWSSSSILTSEHSC